MITAKCECGKSISGICTGREGCTNKLLTEELTRKEMVNHPNHYNKGKIEVIDFIEDQKLNFSRGSIVKYTCRAGDKPDAGKTPLEKEIEDMKKVVWYAQREVERLEELQKLSV